MADTPFDDLLARARAWADADPEPETAAQLREWIDARVESSLRECFDLPLEFGTAGIRGIVGPGPGRMNQAVVRRVTRAIAEHLESIHGAGSTVVLGCDARLDSQRFTRETAAVLSAAGCKVLQFEKPVPTPLVAFATQRQRAAAGIVVTASHNPPEYNGYKVYGDNAIQIVSPVDTLIVNRIEHLPPAKEIPTSEGSIDGISMLGPKCLSEYQESVLESRPKHIHFPLRIAYTPLHGVGWEPVQSLFEQAGYTDLQPVPSQVKPDGRFPTVKFPNPEEPGTLHQGIRLAQSISAHLLLANDPDADRLAMALPDGKGIWHALSGNQLGIVLMDYLLGRAKESKKGHQPLVVSTLVSTPMADSLANACGARIERTLTGFKWLWTAALEILKDQSLEFLLAWEEALGYSTHESVRDKDGVSAALIAADWAAACHAAGNLPWDRLGQLYREHGAWASRQVNIHKPGTRGAVEIKNAFERLSSSPPGDLNGVKIAEIEDFRKNSELRPLWRGYSELVILRLADQSRILARPSGTEPKLKVYIDVPSEVSAGRDPFSVLEDASIRADEMGRWLVNWLEI
jgi:phosphomannomutase